MVQLGLCLAAGERRPDAAEPAARRSYCAHRASPGAAAGVLRGFYRSISLTLVFALEEVGLLHAAQQPGSGGPLQALHANAGA